MYTPEEKKRLAELAGDGGNSKFPRYDVPHLRFNGNTGEFRVRLSGSEEDIPVSKPVSVVILKKMSMLSAYKTKESWFTSEFASPNESIALFHNVEGTVKFVEEGTSVSLKQSHQLLKTQAVLYVLFNGNVHRLVIKGGSLAGYFDYVNKLRDEEKHTFEVATLISGQKAKNEELGTTYYKMEFSYTDSTLALAELEAKMKEVNEALQKIADHRRGNRPTEPTEPDPLEDEFKQSYPESINPDDIPF